MLQAQHWIDKLVKGIISWKEKNGLELLRVDDMKTPSGRVHTGALRGVMLHDVVAKALISQGQKVESTYVFNDMDPMDGLPSYLDPTEYQQHMGKPMYKIPVPALEKSGINISQLSEEDQQELLGAKNFGQLYALDFIQTFRRLGCSQKIIFSHELYESGQMDEAIKLALNNIDRLKQIYQQVADYKLPDKWYPFQVICPKCGKLGSTLVTDWDGEQVSFECQPHKVEWAEGCGYTGKVTPFGGTGKLLWKVDWPAHWHVLGVNIEGAGKDHTSAGGSRDMANHIITDVFHDVVPFNIPYEWILIRGAKMSSSKGVGTSAREFAELFPAEVGRFLFVNKPYAQVIDFDPHTMAIPDLFDEYDQGARIFWQQEEGDQRLGRAFELAQIGPVATAHFLPRFRDVALWMQYPEINLLEKFAEVKGSALNEAETETIADRVKYAQVWLARYAPDEYQFTPHADQNFEVELSDQQKEFLVKANELMESKTWDAADLQQALYELAKQSCGPKPGFEAIYQIFLGKKSGPRAAWFLLSLNQELRKSRISKIDIES